MSKFAGSDSLSQRLSGRNLYLVGMMGSGKSSTGPLLAKELSYAFVDVDLVIEQAAGVSIAKIFELEGQDSFRDVESQVLQSIGERHSLVVATGGGVVMRSQNWGVLHQGIVIWIDPHRDTLLMRLEADSVKRPLLAKKDWVSAFDSLFFERQPLYAEADLHLPVKEESPQVVAQAIVELLPKILLNSGDPDAQRTIEV